LGGWGAADPRASRDPPPHVGQREAASLALSRSPVVPPGAGFTRDEACHACACYPPSNRCSAGIMHWPPSTQDKDAGSDQEPSQDLNCFPSSSGLLNDLNGSRPPHGPSNGVSATRTRRRL